MQLYSDIIVPLLIEAIKFHPETGTTPHKQQLETWCKVRDSIISNGEWASTPKISKQMPIFSVRTQRAYFKLWRMFFDYLQVEFAITDINLIEERHVEDFMQETIDRRVKLSTYKTYAAAMSKLEVALNKLCNTPISFSEILRAQRRIAGNALSRKQKLRSYSNPEEAISMLSPIYRIAANLQLQCGAQVHEISSLDLKNNLLGVKDGFGQLKLIETRLRISRIIQVPLTLYHELKSFIESNGLFSVEYSRYTRSLQKAFLSINEPWFGCHGLRWNYAQNRFLQLQRNENKSFNEALQIVATELGHTNPKSTLHYLR